MGSFAYNQELKDALNNSLKELLDSGSPKGDLLLPLHQIFLFALEKSTEESPVHLTSNFARLSFLLSNAPKLSFKDKYLFHHYRRQGFKTYSNYSIDDLYSLSLHVIHTFMNLIFGEDSFDFQTTESLYQRFGQTRVEGNSIFLRDKKVFILSIDFVKNSIKAIGYDSPNNECIISFAHSDINADWTELFQELSSKNLLPILCNLLDIEIDQEGIFHPQSFVLEPDFLYDVTAISECFGAFNQQEMGFLLRKFLPKSFNKSILLGNVVNYFLDQLIFNPGLSFDQLITKIFMLDPVGIATMTDDDVRELLGQAKIHFDNLKEVVEGPFVKLGISAQDSFIEPSFYSAKYGLQGRLDLFTLKEENANIVELKSSKTYRPNAYGLNNNHYHQTLIYDQLIESVYGNQLKRNNFILYSRHSAQTLRFAPPLKIQQKEAIKQRNKLYLLDRMLLNPKDFISFLVEYSKSHQLEIKGYLKTDSDKLIENFTKLNVIEKSYCNQLLAFTMREFFLSKTGNELSERSTGLASMWTEELSDKIEQFNIINHISLLNMDSNDDETILVFKHTSQTAELNNFRVGDIGVLYADMGDVDSVLRNQVFKCTILQMNTGTVQVRLRSKQGSINIFKEYKYWHIEHDVLENGFYNLTRSIYEFARAAPKYRELIMAIVPPAKYKELEFVNYDSFTASQLDVLNKIISSQDYFLLWGPPGTGKTSVIIKGIAEYYFKKTTQRVLYIAYTNKAVDEICHAIESIDDEIPYIRIGSKYSTAEQFKEKLLDHQIRSISTRKDLRNLLEERKIYVATVASILGQQALFDMLKFNLIVVDEASQIGETSLMGILSKAEKFVLIGDHLQLPAVVQQSTRQSKVEEPDLVKLGYNDFSNSLFERMYKKCRSAGWTHAVSELYEQGRMHTALMNFSNKVYYDNLLKCLPFSKRLKAPSFFIDSMNGLAKVLSTHRMIFIPCRTDFESESLKINQYEATVLTQLIETYESLFKNNNIEVDEGSLGIITPYRAQIAAIRRKIVDSTMTIKDLITIDTVERYQGGARDIILLSCCTNLASQMGSLMSMSDEGLDRKLNVAFTRSKEHFVLIGNEHILRTSDAYSQIIDKCYRLELKLEKE